MTYNLYINIKTIVFTSFFNKRIIVVHFQNLRYIPLDPLFIFQLHFKANKYILIMQSIIKFNYQLNLYMLFHLNLNHIESQNHCKNVSHSVL